MPGDIEAMAVGLPVVAFAVDGLLEIVVHRQTGFLVPSGDISAMTDAVIRLMQEPALRRALGQAGRRRVQNFFSATSTASKVAAVIDDKIRALP